MLNVAVSGQQEKKRNFVVVDGKGKEGTKQMMKIRKANTTQRKHETTHANKTKRKETDLLPIRKQSDEMMLRSTITNPRIFL